MTDNSSDQEFDTVDKLADNQKLIKIYQMQVDDSNQCKPVELGMYPDIPLPVNKIINYKRYDLHVVTYILTEDEIKRKLYKIVGVNVFRRGRKSSMCSLDLVMSDEVKGEYQLLFNDHKNNTTAIVEKLDKFPGKDKVMEYIINKSFEGPIKKIIAK
jgi:hypothetical protein